MFEHIKADKLQPMKDFIKKYNIVDVEPYIYFSSSYSSLNIFNFFYEKVKKNKIILDYYRLLDNAVLNNNLSIFLFLIENGDADFNTDYFSLNAFSVLYRYQDSSGNNKNLINMVKLIMKSLDKKDNLHKIIKKIKNEEILKAIKLIQNTKNF
jgi:hypothetical protein